MSCADLAVQYKVGESTARKITDEFARAVVEVMMPIYMPKMTPELLRTNAVNYSKTWNFPGCVGTADGKHVYVKVSAFSLSAVYFAVSIMGVQAKRFYFFSKKGITKINHKATHFSVHRKPAVSTIATKDGIALS